MNDVPKSFPKATFMREALRREEEKAKRAQAERT